MERIALQNESKFSGHFRRLEELNNDLEEKKIIISFCDHYLSKYQNHHDGKISF